MSTQSKFLYYQLLILFLFLFGVSALSSLDLMLPAYIVLSTIPFVTSLRSVRGSFSLFYFAVVAVYFIYGIAFQDARASITTFCTRYYQFMVLMWLYQNPYVRLDKKSLPKVLMAVVIMETVLNLFLIVSGYNKPESGSFRLVSGNQPVGGNLSVVILPVLVYCYFHIPESRERSVALWGILLCWVLLSGTRGYIILFVLPFLPVLFHFVFGSWQSETNVAKKIAVIFALLAVLFLIILISGDQLTGKFYHLLRMGEGIGRRGKENAIALETFCNTTWYYQVFGMGFGGAPKNIPGYTQAVVRAWGRSWGLQRYLTMKGVAFHSLYSNTLLIQGILGCVLLAVVFIWGFRLISKCRLADSRERFCLYLYWATFFFINNYRWSCDCGIAEMIVLAMAVNQLTGSTDDNTAALELS